MNITKFATILLIIPCLISCYGNKSSKTTQSNNADYDIRLNDSIAAVNAMLEEGNADGEKINAFLDAYISRHPNCFNNDIQRKKAGKELRSLLEKELENNPDFLSDIAVKFASMDKVKSTDNKGYKYLISFTCSSLQAAVLVILRMSAYIVNLKVTIRFGYMMSFSENIPTFLVSIIVSSFGGMMTSSLYRGYNEWLTGINF